MIKSKEYKLTRFQSGSTLIYTVVTIFIFTTVMIAILAYATMNLRVVRSTVVREQAFHIAEAGVNYYQWRLAHFPTDYWDGNASTTVGPYAHDYIDKDTNKKMGQYSLKITRPSLGSTIVTIESTGSTVQNPSVKRKLTVRYGVPSLAQFGFLSNSFVRVGSGSTFYGKFHSNSGIEFNGVGNAPITSARSTYTCQSGDGCSGNHPGIWGSAPQSTQNLWDFPVPNVDFSAITSDLASIKSAAQSAGKYLPPASGGNGYVIRFQNNATYRVYRVTSLPNHATGYDAEGDSHTENINYGSLAELTTVCSPYPCQMPANGLIFVEDDVWAEGVVNGRVLLAAAAFPYNSNSAPSVMIQNNLTYLAKDGNHVLGIIGQKHVLITHNAPNNLEINAALIAQNGSFQRYRFPDTLKNTLTVYGSISSFGQAAIYYGDSGYQTRNYTYDNNLLFGPPPNFPLSSEGYQTISWNSD